jgi:hypothetical protein
MKSNKSFIVIMLSVVLFAGTTFEIQAINWKDYVQDVSTWITRLVNTLSDYKDRVLTFIVYRSEYPVVRNKLVKAKYLEQHKAIVMGSTNYEKMLDRMLHFKNDSNPRGICDFMQTFVQNYVKADDQIKNIVKKEHAIFNATLKALRDADISWFEIMCLTNRFYINESDAFINAWAFFNQLQQFDSMWLHDKTLDVAIEQIEKVIV